MIEHSNRNIGECGLSEIDLEKVTCDMRQRHRDVAEIRWALIRMNSRLLLPHERSLLRIILDCGNSYQDVARLSGLAASTVSRRFARILRRLNGDLGRMAAGKHEALGVEDISIAREYFLRGNDQLSIAVKLDVSRYKVRKVIGRIRELVYAGCDRSFKSEIPGRKSNTHSTLNNV